MTDYAIERDKSRASRQALRLTMRAYGVEPAKRELWCGACHEFTAHGDLGKCGACGEWSEEKSLAHRESLPYLHPAVLCDLDGTLSSCEWRRPHADAKDWRKFFELMAGDAPVAWLLDLLKRWSDVGAVVLIASGRPVDYETPTRWWLREHAVPVDALFMRPRGDYRSDAEVKADIWDREIGSKFRVLRAWDDRESIAEVWRSRGVPVRVVEDPGAEPLLDRDA